MEGVEGREAGGTPITMAAKSLPPDRGCVRQIGVAKAANPPRLLELGLEERRWWPSMVGMGGDGGGGVHLRLDCARGGAGRGGNWRRDPKVGGASGWRDPKVGGASGRRDLTSGLRQGTGQRPRTGRGLDLDRGEGERESRRRGGERGGCGLLGLGLGC